MRWMNNHHTNDLFSMAKGTTVVTEKAKAVFNSVLQSSAQIHRAMDDILGKAAEDGVTCMLFVLL